MKIILTITFTLFYLLSCKSPKEKIHDLIYSNGPCDRIRGFVLMGKYMDTSFLKDIFSDQGDRQICHSLKYYGKNPLWAKIKALEQITNVKLPYKYTSFSLDSTALIFYKQILLNKK